MPRKKHVRNVDAEEARPAGSRRASSDSASDCQSLADAEELLTGLSGSVAAGLPLGAAPLFSREGNADRVLDALADGIVAILPCGTVTFFNRAAENILGFNRAEILGRNVHDLVPDQLRAEHDEHLARLASTGSSSILGYRREIVGQRRDGSRIPLELHVGVLDSERGPVYVGIVSDISLRKEHERKLDEHAEELQVANEELRVANEDLQVANEELVRLRDTAEAANRAKSAFLANMSHEIRTPVTAIMGYADLLLRDDGFATTPEHRLEATGAIQRNAAHLSSVISDILDLSKIEAGKIEIECVDCSPTQILADVVDLMLPRAQVKGIGLLHRCEGDLPRSIRSDPVRLRQVLANLVDNAIKFTSVGAVEVIARLVDGDVPRLVVDVADTGIGMTSQQQRHLFQPFTQADSSTTRSFGGTGLGLSISRRLARMLGGDVVIVDSVPQRGSRFRFTAVAGSAIRGPAASSAQTRQAGESAAKQWKQPLQTLPLAGRRILLAEDGPDNQRLISLVLAKAGATGQVVENGQQAVHEALKAQAAHRPFDVILMDMQMPVLDGYDATAALRAAGYWGVIIAVTAHALEGDRDKCLAAGCDDYATKPIDREKFVAQVLNACPRGTAREQRRQPDQLPATPP
jgi:PAS domain S-box-containing protein